MLQYNLRFLQQDGVFIADEIIVNPTLSEPGEHSLEQWILHELEATQKNLAFLREIKKQIVDAQLKIKAQFYSASEEAEICTICQTEYEGREIIAALNCGHEYHRDCIKDWLAIKNVCPLCKSTAMDYL